jgi:CRP/FNR family cyclic AMP-dependent transcriptional regulator
MNQELLRGVPIFAGLDPSAVDFLLKKAELRVYNSGEIILREGEAGNRFCLLAEGAVDVVKALNSERPVILASLRRGDFFGELCILETLPRSASVVAREVTTIVSVASVAFYHLHQEMPSQHGILLLNIARDLSRRLRRLDEIFAGRH